jgi:hypothetical protein
VVGRRYTGIKGAYWETFSIYIRIRDFKKYGRCISCDGAVSDWREFDAGHFIPAGSCGFALLFDALNVSAQCRKCNRGGATVEMYARGLDARYGPGTAEELKDRYRDCHFKGKTTKEWSPREYEAKLAELDLKLAAL